MDPMYWLGDGGVFGSAVLVGVMVIIFVETGLLFPFLPGEKLHGAGGNPWDSMRIPHRQACWPGPVQEGRLTVLQAALCDVVT